jgi:bacillithiol system protein YtxJ
MEWTPLESAAQLKTIQEESNTGPVLVFKHSTRCSISTTVLGRLNRAAGFSKPINAWFLDLIAHRDLSNALATQYDIEHESPQVLILRNGKAVEALSHFDIQPTEINRILDALPA